MRDHEYQEMLASVRERNESVHKSILKKSKKGFDAFISRDHAISRIDKLEKKRIHEDKESTVPAELSQAGVAFYSISSLQPRGSLLASKKSDAAADTGREIIEEAFKIVKDARSTIVFDPDHTDVVLVVGNTGTGKSTLVQFIAGDNSKLKAVEVPADSGNFLIHDDGKKISDINSTMKSKTLFPELVINNTKDLAFYDCAGFKDSRGTAYDMAATYLTKMVFDRSTSIKVHICVEHETAIGTSGRGAPFVDAIKHVGEFIRDAEKFKDSFSMVATKVSKITRENDDGDDIAVPDKTLIKNIGDFITNNVIKDVESRIKEERRPNEKLYLKNALIIVKALSTKKDGVYNRIGLFRKSQRAGPLDKSKLMQNSRAGILSGIRDETSFAESSKTDFGFSVSSDTKNDMSRIAKELNLSLKNGFNNIGTEIEAEVKERMRTSQDWRATEKYLDQLKKMLAEVKAHFETTTTLTPEFILGLRATVKNHNLSVSCDVFKTIEEDINYLEFLGNMIEENVLVIPTGSLDKCIKVVTEGREWYQILFKVYENLCADKFQEDTKQYNVANLDDWGKTGKEQRIRINPSNIHQFFKLLKINSERIGKLDLDEIRMHELNSITNLTLIQEPKIDVTSKGTLLATGPFIRLSKVMEKYQSNKGTVKAFNIFASCAVYIDTDVDASGRHMLIAAPTWNVVTKCSINISGTPGKDEDGTPAEAGKGQTPGETGVPGGAGTAAGHFVGLANTVNDGKDLTITANGGRGGRGQMGGKGPNGIDGEDGPVRPEPDWANSEPIGRYKQIGREEITPKVGWVEYEYKYQIFAERAATDGQNGGDGGAGGFGGPSGEVYLDIFSRTAGDFPSIENNAGSRGTDGGGGTGGRYARNGNDILARRWTGRGPLRMVNFKGGWEHRGIYGHDKGYSKRGKIGMSGGNKHKMEAEHKSDPIFKLAHNVNEIKAASIAAAAQCPLRRAELEKFAKEIDRSSNIEKIYDISGFLNEMDTLEGQFYAVQNFIDTQSYYESLLQRITAYAEEHKNKTTKIQRIALGTIYSSCLSKICSLKMENKASSLIVDLQSYIESTISRIEDLTTMDRREAIKGLQKSYSAGIELKVKEANDLMGKKVQPAIDKILKEMDAKLEKLVDETVEKQEAQKLSKDELLAAQAEMEKAMFIKGALNILKLGATVASFAGPIGAAIGGVVTAGATIGEQFVVEPDVTGKSILLPKGVKETIEGLGGLVKAVREKKIKSLETQLKSVEDELEGTKAEDKVDLKDVEAKVKELRVKLQTEKSKKIGSNDEDAAAAQVEAIGGIEKELQTSLKQKEKGLKQEIERGNKSKEKVLGYMTKINNTLTVIQGGLDVYESIKGDKKKLDTISDAIRQADENIKALQNYEHEIYTMLFPMVRNMRENVQEVTDSLAGKSQVALDVTKWEIQGTLNGICKTLEQAMDGFEVQAEVTACFEQLDQAMSLLMHIYDRLENFYDQQKLGDYIANIGAPGQYDDLLKNTEYDQDVTAMNMTIRSNLVLLEFDLAMRAFKQWVFPFAKIFLEATNLPSTLKPVRNTETLQSLVATASKHLKLVKAKITNYWATIQYQDSFLFNGKFYCNEKIGGPFYSWPNIGHKKVIEALFRGESVSLFADVRNQDRSVAQRKAIKFQKVYIRFHYTGKDEKLKVKFEDKLEYFVVNLVHSGTNYYEFEDEVYVIQGEPVTLTYGIKGEVDPDIQSISREKVLTGDLLLSPYTLWTIQLSADHKDAYTEIKPFVNDVTLELAGTGMYIFDKEKQLASLDLRPYDYYQIDGKLAIESE